MTIAAIFGGACGLIAIAAWVSGRPTDKADGKTDELAAGRVYSLDVERPLDFLREYLPAALVSRPGSLCGDDAVEETAAAKICRANKCQEMEIEQLSGVKMDSSKYYIRFLGRPATLEDTYSLALRLCDIAGIPNDRIRAWHEEKKYENVLTRTQLQTASDGTNTHSVEVRSSLALQGDKLWRVIYTLHFTAPQLASDN